MVGPVQIAGLDEGDVIISLGQSPVNGVDNIHRQLIGDVIGQNLEIVLLRGWTTRLEMPIIPAASPE